MSAIALAVPDHPTLPDRLSQSFLSDAQHCLRRAQLRREADTVDEIATVGTAVHQIAAAAAEHAQAEGVERLSSLVIEEIAHDCIRRPEIDPDHDSRIDALSLDGWRRVMQLARMFGATAEFPADAEYEVPCRRELDGFVFSARIDKVRLVGTTCEIEDYKSGGRLPKRDAPKITFQLEHYAWQALGRWPWITDFVLRENFVPYGVVRTGRLSTFDLLNGTDSADPIEDYLSDTAFRLEEAYAEPGELKARAGSWCHSCPDRAGCPLPAWAKGAPIRSRADAETALSSLIRKRAEAEQLGDDLRAWIDGEDIAHVVSGDMEIGHKMGIDGSRFAVRKAREDET
jgi:hypothetical protein